MSFDPSARAQTGKSVSLLMSRSRQSTRDNQTGSWRFVRPVFENKTAPCRRDCPAGEDIAQIATLVGEGWYKEAFEAVLAENPFPAVCGYVCFHPCEAACNRERFDAPVTVQQIERYLGCRAISEKWPLPDAVSSNGRRIAVLGAGPAGLAAAYFLCRLGFACDVYEKNAEPGGLMRWGIPGYRLPSSVLKAEIERILCMGVRIHCDRRMEPEDLDAMVDRYDAVFLAHGQTRPLRLNIPGAEWVVEGRELLEAVAKGERPEIGGDVAVIGGGNTAVDVARTLVRMGATPVIWYRRRREDMPAFEDALRKATAEGVEVQTLYAPTEIERAGHAYRLKMQAMAPTGAGTESGRARVTPVAAGKRVIEADHVICAIGAEADDLKRWRTSADGRCLKLSHGTLVAAHVPLIFGGDWVNRQQSVADAVASGKQAAMTLNHLLQHGAPGIQALSENSRVAEATGLSMAAVLGDRPQSRSASVVSFDDLNTEYFEHSSPGIPAGCEATKGADCEADVPLLTAAQAVTEAQRCFSCGTCNECDNCRLFCPDVAVSVAPRRHVDLQYCKGCGICAIECPRNAITLVREGG